RGDFLSLPPRTKGRKQIRELRCAPSSKHCESRWIELLYQWKKCIGKKRVRNSGFDSIGAPKRDVPSLVCSPLCCGSGEARLANSSLDREKYRSAGPGFCFG